MRFAPKKASFCAGLACSTEILANVSRRALLSPAEDSMNDNPDLEMAVFTEAVKIAPAERPEFLDKACGGDENLRHKVEGLLKAHDRIGSFLEQPPTGDFVE